MLLQKSSDAIAASQNMLQMLNVLLLQVEQGYSHDLLFIQEISSPWDGVRIRYRLFDRIWKKRKVGLEALRNGVEESVLKQALICDAWFYVIDLLIEDDEVLVEIF